MEKIKTLYLLRGLPGSGKSTLAYQIADVYGEADMFFIDKKTGEYKFDPSKLKEAHEKCLKGTEKFMEFGIGKIAISNTFTQEWEIKPYYELAEKYGYRVVSLICENRHNGINTHNVPEETIEKMKKRFEVKL